jgi:hypothetical protein
VPRFLDIEKGIRMVDRIDLQNIANVWQQAADKVASLRREGTGDSTATWNEAIAQAEALLREGVDDVLFTARMAHMLIVGNVHADSPDTTVAKGA